MSISLGSFALLGLIGSLDAVKHENFKTCAQSGFCKRNRAFADSVSAKGSTGPSSFPYKLDSNSVSLKNGQLVGTIIKTVSDNESVRLPLTVTFLKSGVARVTVDEERRQKGDIELRHGSTVRKERYNEAAKWAITGDLSPSPMAELDETSEPGVTKVVYGPNKQFKAVIKHSPFAVDFVRDGETHIQLNNRGFLNVEHWRAKIESKGGDEKGDSSDDESTWWDESFGGNTDSKPRGPESVGLDITFPGYAHVYGIPEHADSMSLKETR